MNGASKGSKEYYAARGFSKPVGKANATFLQKVTFNWAAPILQKGARNEITEDTAEAFVDEQNSAPHQARTFEEAYIRLKVWITLCNLSIGDLHAAAHVMARKCH